MGCTVALTGNPNCGKTTLFNRLTGAHHTVGNWAGVTVEKKTGRALHRGTALTLVDLPGIYSLTPFSVEEVCARDYLMGGEADVVLDVLDGTNMERNLYLALLLTELGLPVVLAVNLMDEVQARGGDIDCARLSALLGVPVLPISARTGQGVEALLDAVLAAREAGGARRARVPDSAGEDVDEAVRRADARYRFLEDVCAQAVRRPPQSSRQTVTQRLDAVVTNRVLALPIFLLLMAAMFSAVFGRAGMAMKAGLEHFFAAVLSPWVLNLLAALHAPEWLCALTVDGVIGGVGGVLAFLPQITLLFLFLSLLEDSGYMARAAFIMDRPLRGLGLSGKAFIPMLMGFGCTTPAVMAARALETERDRRLTILLLPFLSCGARLPVYALFAGAFFAQRQGLVVFGLYLLGVCVAVCVGLLLRGTLFQGGRAPLLLELPAYRLPTVRGTLTHLWEKCGGFVAKAGTVLFWMSILVWMLQSFDPSLRYLGGANAGDSMFAYIGRLVAPLLAPLGFGTWQAAAALLSGVVAKEAVVSTLGVLYGSGGVGAAFTPASACAFLVFTLLYTPCVAALATIRRELHSTCAMLLVALGNTAVAYAAAWITYRVASLFLH